MPGLTGIIIGFLIGVVAATWFYAHGGNVIINGQTLGPDHQYLVTCLQKDSSKPSGSPSSGNTIFVYVSPRC
jgi:type III secretory pathway component EscT